MSGAVPPEAEVPTTDDSHRVNTHAASDVPPMTCPLCRCCGRPNASSESCGVCQFPFTTTPGAHETASSAVPEIDFVSLFGIGQLPRSPESLRIMQRNLLMYMRDILNALPPESDARMCLGALAVEHQLYRIINARSELIKDYEAQYGSVHTVELGARFDWSKYTASSHFVLPRVDTFHTSTAAKSPDVFSDGLGDDMRSQMPPTSSHMYHQRRISQMINELDNKSVSELKQLLGQIGLRKSGKKEDLISRLSAYFMKFASTTPPPEDTHTFEALESHSDIPVWRLPPPRKGTFYEMTDSGSLAREVNVVFDAVLDPMIELHKLYLNVEDLTPAIGPPLTDMFCVYYIEHHWDINQQSLHHLCFLAKRSYSILFSPRSTPFLTRDDMNTRNNDEVCPVCQSPSEAWDLNAHRTASNELLNWIASFFDFFKYLELRNTFKDSKWNLGLSVLRICKEGHVVVTKVEEREEVSVRPDHLFWQ